MTCPPCDESLSGSAPSYNLEALRYIDVHMSEQNQKQNQKKKKNPATTTTTHEKGSFFGVESLKQGVA